MNITNDRDVNKEIWKDIKGYEEFYQISNKGRIKSKARIIKYKNGKTISKKERILRQCNDKDGYKIITLSPINKHFRIHRLVAEMFIPNPDNYPIVNHKDKNIKNNNVENLEWCTYSYNNTYDGAMDSKRKKVLQFDLNKKFIKEWKSIMEAAKAVNTSAGNIVECCKGKHKHIKKYIWKYKEELKNETNN